MKKLIAGIIIGASLASAVFYFIRQRDDTNQKENLAEIVELLKQGQAKREKTKDRKRKKDENAMWCTADSFIL